MNRTKGKRLIRACILAWEGGVFQVYAKEGKGHAGGPLEKKDFSNHGYLPNARKDRGAGRKRKKKEVTDHALPISGEKEKEG